VPKVKTNKSAAKRFKRTKSGKFLRHQAFNRHLKTGKSAKRRRNLRKGLVASDSNVNAIKEMLPYS